ncbi:MAG: hypothetical protein ACREOO_04405 [bacterium]
MRHYDFDALIRSNNFSAGSALGSCGTSFPSKGFFQNILLQRGGFLQALYERLSSNLSQPEGRLSIS